MRIVRIIENIGFMGSSSCILMFCSIDAKKRKKRSTRSKKIKREEFYMHVNRKTGSPGFQKKMLCSAISLSLLPVSGAVLAQDDVVEEVASGDEASLKSRRV